MRTCITITNHCCACWWLWPTRYNCRVFFKEAPSLFSQMASFSPPVIFYFEIVTLVCFLFGGGGEVEKNVATMGRRLSFHSIDRCFWALAVFTCWEQSSENVAPESVISPHGAYVLGKQQADKHITSCQVIVILWSNWNTGDKHQIFCWVWRKTLKPTSRNSYWVEVTKRQW